MFSHLRSAALAAAAVSFAAHLLTGAALAEPTPANDAATSPSATSQAPTPDQPATPDAAAAPAPANPAPTASPAVPATAPAPAAAATPQPELLGALVRKQIEAASAKLEDAERADADALKAFYDLRKDEPLWIAGETSLSPKAAAAIAEIKKADDWGLEAKAFLLPDSNGQTLTREQAADAEFKLSMAVLKYARFARGGRITDPAHQLSSYLDRMPQLIEPKVVLEQIAAATDADATLRGFHPKNPQFEKLRQRYLELKKSADSAGAVPQIPKGPKLVPGKKDPNVVVLRKRMGTAPQTGTDETYYDDVLATAVEAFQTSKELKADGVVNVATRNALNEIETPSPMRILANMEEWRWMPEDLGKFYITANLPEFMIRVFKDGKMIHEERVVTGQPTKQTPVFSAEMDLVTLHPRWNVPESIKVRELYPSLARGGNSIARQGLRLTKNGREVDPYSVDWSTADIRKFDIYQPSGPSNALGVVKLSFPNKHIVYFHDTPSKSLFNEASRAFSHGCVRVRNPMRLAEVVLAEDKGWDAAHVESLLQANPEENPIALDHKYPVHLTYFTTWIDDEGKEQSVKDVYGHEKRISLALQGRFKEIERGPDHLAPVSYAELRLSQQKNAPAFGSFFGGLFGGF